MNTIIKVKVKVVKGGLTGRFLIASFEEDINVGAIIDPDSSSAIYCEEDCNQAIKLLACAIAKEQVKTASMTTSGTSGTCVEIPSIDVHVTRVGEAMVTGTLKELLKLNSKRTVVKGK